MYLSLSIPPLKLEICKDVFPHTIYFNVNNSLNYFCIYLYLFIYMLHVRLKLCILVSHCESYLLQFATYLLLLQFINFSYGSIDYMFIYYFSLYLWTQLHLWFYFSYSKIYFSYKKITNYNILRILIQLRHGH